jgi:hypothetical protein
MIMETDRVEFVFGENTGGFCFLFGIVLPFYVAVVLQGWALDGWACLDRQVCSVGGREGLPVPAFHLLLEQHILFLLVRFQ